MNRRGFIKILGASVVTAAAIPSALKAITAPLPAGTPSITISVDAGASRAGYTLSFYGRVPGGDWQYFEELVTPEGGSVTLYPPVGADGLAAIRTLQVGLGRMPTNYIPTTSEVKYVPHASTLLQDHAVEGEVPELVINFENIMVLG